MGCTNLAVLPQHTREGKLLLAGNYDWYYSAGEWREVRLVRPQEGYSHLAVSHHWAGSPDGLNERGLAVFLSVLPEMEAIGPGLQWQLVMDMMMERCKDIQEARQLITSFPHLRAFNYLIADGSQAMVAEATPRFVSIREPEEGFLVATNHLPGRERPEEELTERDRERQRRSLARYQRASLMLRERLGQMDGEGAKEILRDHQAPICRGDHPPLPTLGGFHTIFGTIWSLICQPEDGELLIAEGHPCGAEYEPYSFEVEDG